jgi:hypothetical protein
MERAGSGDSIVAEERTVNEEKSIALMERAKGMDSIVPRERAGSLDSIV